MRRIGKISVAVLLMTTMLLGGCAGKPKAAPDPTDDNYRAFYQIFVGIISTCICLKISEIFLSRIFFTKEFDSFFYLIGNTFAPKTIFRIESLVIAMHITKQDYLKLKKSIKSNLKDIKELLSNANNKEILVEIKDLVETLLTNCDELYLYKQKPNKEITI